MARNIYIYIRGTVDGYRIYIYTWHSGWLQNIFNVVLWMFLIYIYIHTHTSDNLMVLEYIYILGTVDGSGNYY